MTSDANTEVYLKQKGNFKLISDGCQTWMEGFRRNREGLMSNAKLTAVTTKLWLCTPY